jgi:hypothetical protein
MKYICDMNAFHKNIKKYSGILKFSHRVYILNRAVKKRGINKMDCEGGCLVNNLSV